MRDELRLAAPATYEHDAGDLDLGAMWRALDRRKSWIVGATLLAFVAALAFVFLVTPRYTGSSQVLVENQENFFTRPGGASADPTTPPDDAAVASQIQLVTSTDLARQAIKSLSLAQNPEFNPHAHPGLLARLAALVGLYRSPSLLSDEDQILQNYFDRLTVFQVQKSRVLEIDFTSKDRDLAARAANKIADLYIGVQIATKRQQAQQDAASLGERVKDLQTRLAAAEDKAESFRASSGLLVGPNNTTLSAQQLADLNTQLAAAGAAEADAGAKAKLIRSALSQGRLDEISDIANNELVRQISIQRVTLRAQLALQSRTLLPQHPQIKELKAQLSDLDSQLRSAAVTVARGLENDARLTQARYDSIEATLDQQKRAVGDRGADEVRMRALDRQAKLIADQLETTTAKYQEALARETASSTPGDARVISRAIPPQLPSFPRKLPTLIFATLAGLVLATAAALAAELLGGGADPVPVPFRREDLNLVAPYPGPRKAAEAAFRKPPFFDEAGSQPVVSSEPVRDGLSGLMAQATAISRRSEKAACILVFGAGDEVGAGPWAVELGRRLAAEGRSILIELRSGLLAGSGLRPAGEGVSGFGELIEGERSFAEAIERDGASRLHFIVAGRAKAHSGESLDVAMEALGETYDYVLLLAASIASDPLTRDIAAAADLVAVVGDANGSELPRIRTELLRAGAGEIIAVQSYQPREAVDAA